MPVIHLRRIVMVARVGEDGLVAGGIGLGDGQAGDNDGAREDRRGAK